ncbi:MAG: biotin-dependent carboxyltransferase family protein [Henriciella sp.]
MLRVAKPGLQTTLQGAQRLGHRSFGLPYAGPADAVSMSLANRLVANPPNATCLEITYGGFEAEIEHSCALAITGAVGAVQIGGARVAPHTTLHAKAGDLLTIAPPKLGSRAYLAIASGFQAKAQFGSTSTYLPASLGGLTGHAIGAGDRLAALEKCDARPKLETPTDLRPILSDAYALRACTSAETHLLSADALHTLFNARFIAGQQATRMGISLTGHPLDLRSDGMMKSAPVFPGMVQCPQSGVPIALSCDAQTTGGYPRIASIARCDRHLLGQIRPGNAVILLKRTPEDAVAEGLAKRALLSDWLDA